MKKEHGREGNGGRAAGRQTGEGSYFVDTKVSFIIVLKNETAALK